MAHERLKFPDPSQPSPRSLPNALRNPLRAATLAAAAVTIFGAIQPFMRIWTPGTGWTDITGFEQAGDGGFVLELAAVAAILTWVDGAWNSRIVVLVAGPAVLGAAALVILFDYYRTGAAYLTTLVNSGSHGNFEPGFWLSSVGAVALTICGTITTWRARARLSFRTGLRMSSFAGVVGGLAGAVLGFVAGAAITPLLFHDVVGREAFVLVVVATSLALAGTWIGAAVASALVRGNRSS
jgi:hypothetical protein